MSRTDSEYEKPYAYPGAEPRDAADFVYSSAEMREMFLANEIPFDEYQRRFALRKDAAK